MRVHSDRLTKPCIRPDALQTKDMQRKTGSCDNRDNGETIDSQKGDSTCLGSPQSLLSTTCAMSVLAIACIIPVVAASLFMSKNNISNYKIYIAIALVSTLLFSVISTFSLIFLWGTKRLVFSQKFMMWLGGATVAEAAGMTAIIIKALFG